MKKYKVTVDGQTYTVIVEEIAAGEHPSGETGAPAAAPAPPQRSTAPKAPPPQESATPQKSAPAAAAALTVNSPMPGEILEVAVKPGETVNEGDVLLILEAMKMENEITAPRGGTVSAVRIKAGDTVGSGDPLVEIA